jgi:hypothetical protein
MTTPIDPLVACVARSPDAKLVPKPMPRREAKDVLPHAREKAVRAYAILPDMALFDLLILIIFQTINIW